MDAKEAQEQTEKRWLATIADSDDYPLACGWCIFAIGMTTENMSQCHKCPVVYVFGESCQNIQEYIDWEETRVTDAARKVYDLLVAHKHHLIAAAKEIEDEYSGRVK